MKTGTMRKYKKKHNKKYRIIYADPPWPSSNAYGFGTKREKKYGDKIRYYPCNYKLMTNDEIMKLHVREIAAKNSMLFLWTINWKLPLALSVIEAWGFEYKTVAFVWSKKTQSGKQRHLCSQYTMLNCELCLLATRGHPHSLVKSRNIKQLIEAPVTEHSSKPDEVRTRIVQLVGNIPRIELFGRKKTKGWDIWGNEVRSSIKL